MASTGCRLDPKARPATSGGPKPSPTTLDSIRATLVAEAGARSAVFDALSTLGVDAGSDGDLTISPQNPTVAFIAASDDRMRSHEDRNGPSPP